MNIAQTLHEPKNSAIFEQIVTQPDLAKLSPQERSEYYHKVCESLGLNPLTKPFDYIYLNGKLTLYAKKDATDQLRKLYNVSITISGRDRIGDIYIVTAKARLPNGRLDEATGALPVGGLKGNDLANAFMKAETKAKRRVTLSICGLGILDESELDTINHASPDAGSAQKAQQVLKTEESAEAQQRLEPRILEPESDQRDQHPIETGRTEIVVTGREVSADDESTNPHVGAVAEYVVKCGRRYKGKRLGDIHRDEIKKYLQWLEGYAAKNNRKLTGDFLEFSQMANDYLARLDA